MAATRDETYMRVCVLARGHEGDHLPYRDAPDKDEFGNKEIEHPRCLHVDPVSVGDEEPRYRLIFEIIDPRYPEAGWHEVVRESSELSDLRAQMNGLAEIAAAGDDVRNARIEAATLTWTKLEL